MLGIHSLFAPIPNTSENTNLTFPWISLFSMFCSHGTMQNVKFSIQPCYFMFSWFPHAVHASARRCSYG